MGGVVDTRCLSSGSEQPRSCRSGARHDCPKRSNSVGRPGQHRHPPCCRPCSKGAARASRMTRRFSVTRTALVVVEGSADVVVPKGSGCCSAPPGLQRGLRLSSPMTSPTLRIFAATASASVARQSWVQSGLLDRRASPLPSSTTSGAPLPPGSSRTAAPPAVSGPSMAGSVAKAAAVVNILVLDAGMKRDSGESRSAPARPRRDDEAEAGSGPASCRSLRSVLSARALGRRRSVTARERTRATRAATPLSRFSGRGGPQRSWGGEGLYPARKTSPPTDSRGPPLPYGERRKPPRLRLCA